MPGVITSPKADRRQDYIARRQHKLPPNVQFVDYEPRGASRQLFKEKSTAVVISGPAGTGKTRAGLEKANWLCEKYPGIRGIMVRKTRRSITQSCMVTFEKKVLLYEGQIPFHGQDQEYRYPNGSIFAVAGIDDPKKIYSSEWDFCYANQAEELEAEDWETIISRLRYWHMPYQQIFADCNPGPPTHWIKNFQATGRLVMLESRHEDNPELYDIKTGQWTSKGAIYIGQLDSLTGVRKARLRHGKWAAAEGTVFEESWNPAVHIINRFPIPTDWPRFWSFDFGYTHPFVWQAWAQDPDGRLYRYHEIYKTKTLVEDHARRILEITKDEPKPRFLICDHDAEDRATLERHLKMSTKGAWKSVRPGIQAVEARLRIQGDGKPRIFFLRDSVADPDRALTDAHLPACTEEEADIYIWDTANSRKLGEEPVKENDHGWDTTRYVITFVDKTKDIRQEFFAIGSATRSGGGDSSLTGTSGWRIGDNSPDGSVGSLARWGK